jgi:hypothetical protein
VAIVSIAGVVTTIVAYMFSSTGGKP